MVPSMMMGVVVAMMVTPMIMTPMMLEEVVMAAVVVIVVVVVVMATMISVLDHLHQAGLRLNALGRKGGSRLGCECRRREVREPANHRGNERVLHQLALCFVSPAWHLGADCEDVAMNRL
jgi:hypothetical protein